MFNSQCLGTLHIFRRQLDRSISFRRKTWESWGGGAAGRVESESLLRCSKDHRPGDLLRENHLLISPSMMHSQVDFFFQYLFHCIYMYERLHVCYTTCPCVPCALRGQKKTSDSLELELQIVLNCHVGPRSQTQGLCKNNKCS